MRIVYVTQRLPFGAGETFIVPEVEALLAAGHDMLIVPRRSSDPIVHDDVAALVARTQRLPGALHIAASAMRAAVSQPGRVAGALWRLRATRPRRRGVFNALATAEGLWLARVARQWGADHIHAHWAHLTATMAMGASEVSGIPWSFTAHRYDVVLNNLLDAKLRSARFGRFIARHMLELARGLVSPEAGARALALHMGVPVPPAPDFGTPAGTPPVILCPARLVPMKGHGPLLDAAAQLAAAGIAFELWLAGDGPEGPAIARRIQGLGLEDRVRMLGLVPHAELLGWYRDRRVDCVVLPSLDLGGGLHEGLSVALLEAMAHGVPIISTPTGGLPELLGNGAGLLVPSGDAEALGGALHEVIGSPPLRTALARAGRRRIEEEFDTTAIAGELARLFAGVPATSSIPVFAHAVR